MTEMNALLKQLQPDPLATVELVDALRAQCEALDYRTGAQVTSVFGDLPPNAQLPEGASLTIFRIVQEAFANIARHARASQVHVRLEPHLLKHELWLEIRDDGQGFEVTKAPRGLGLANMLERATAIGAQLDVTSTLGEGTVISVAIPLAIQA